MSENDFYFCRHGVRRTSATPCRACGDASTIERLQRELDDERGWNFKRREQFDRIGKALESRRLRRETGEPARSDADEVESLIAELGKAERERDEAKAAIRDALEVGCVIGTAETVLRAALDGEVRLTTHDNEDTFT